MRGSLLFACLGLSLALVGTTAPAADPPADPALARAAADTARSPKHVARDRARHPVAELHFFGLQPTMNVVEVWPGGGYWTEILAPYLKEHGTYTAAVTVDGEDKEEDGVTTRWRALVAAAGPRFGTVHVTTLGAGHFVIAPPGSADLVLTFRNLHNWMSSGYAEPAMAAMYAALKPGGILGIEEHRGRTDRPQDPKAENGYVREDYTKDLARKAGFEFVGSSELNANPKDTKDWPDGVWTLPPTLAQGDKDRAKYEAIGESDNFVLKFRKPKH
jgi:predicted methyltransferase